MLILMEGSHPQLLQLNLHSQQGLIPDLNSTKKSRKVSPKLNEIK